MSHAQGLPYGLQNMLKVRARRARSGAQRVESVLNAEECGQLRKDRRI